MCLSILASFNISGRNLSYCLTCFLLSWLEASTHQIFRYYYVTPFQPPRHQKPSEGPSNYSPSSHFDLSSQAQVGGQSSGVSVGVFPQTACDLEKKEVSQNLPRFLLWGISKRQGEDRISWPRPPGAERLDGLQLEHVVHSTSVWTGFLLSVCKRSQQELFSHTLWTTMPWVFQNSKSCHSINLSLYFWFG